MLLAVLMTPSVVFAEVQVTRDVFVDPVEKAVKVDLYVSVTGNEDFAGVTELVPCGMSVLNVNCGGFYQDYKELPLVQDHDYIGGCGNIDWLFWEYGNNLSSGKCSYMLQYDSEGVYDFGGYVFYASTDYDFETNKIEGVSKIDTSEKVNSVADLISLWKSDKIPLGWVVNYINEQS